LKNPRRIKIQEPAGKNIFGALPGDKGDGTAAKQLLAFYLTIHSIKGSTIQITSLAQADPKALKRSKRVVQRPVLPDPANADLVDNFINYLQGREEVQHLVADPGERVFNKEARNIKVTRRKMKNDIKEVIEAPQLRDKVISTAVELEKIKKQDERPARVKVQAPAPSDRRLSRDAKKLTRDQLITLNKAKREKCVEDDRQQRIDGMQFKKWDDFRQRRLQIIDSYIRARKHQETAKLVITLGVGILGLRRFRAGFDRIAAQVRAGDRIRFLLVGVMFKYRRRMRQYGSTLETRERRYARNVLTSYTVTMNHQVKLRSARDHLLPFLREIRYRATMKLYWRNMMERILFIQRTFKRQIAIKTARMQGLTTLWDKY